METMAIMTRTGAEQTECFADFGSLRVTRALAPDRHYGAGEYVLTHVATGASVLRGGKGALTRIGKRIAADFNTLGAAATRINPKNGLASFRDAETGKRLDTVRREAAEAEGYTVGFHGFLSKF